MNAARLIACCPRSAVSDLTAGLGPDRHYYCGQCGAHAWQGRVYTARQWSDWINSRDESQPDPRPGFYYVTAKQGARTAWLAGPFDNHAAALAHVAPASRLAIEHDPAMFFVSFGTARYPDGVTPRPIGVFNAALLSALLYQDGRLASGRDYRPTITGAQAMSEVESTESVPLPPPPPVAARKRIPKPSERKAAAAPAEAAAPKPKARKVAAKPAKKAAAKKAPAKKAAAKAKPARKAAPKVKAKAPASRKAAAKPARKAKPAAKKGKAAAAGRAIVAPTDPKSQKGRMWAAFDKLANAGKLTTERAKAVAVKNYWPTNSFNVALCNYRKHHGIAAVRS